MSEPAPTRPAATVIVLRQRPEDGTLETFLLLRPGKGAFPGAHVFPGGAVDPADADPRWAPRCDGFDVLALTLGGSLDAEALRVHAVAAIREVFEEIGVLIGRAPRVTPELLAGGRRALLASETTFLDWCERHDVRLACDALRPWAHWITPVVEPRRFDTWFFVGRAPVGQAAAILPGEALEGSWMPVVAALDALRSGTLFLAPPTLRTLEELSSLVTIAAVMQASAFRRLSPVMPHRLTDVSPPTLVIPGDRAHSTPGPAGVDGPSRFVLRQGRWHSEHSET